MFDAPHRWLLPLALLVIAFAVLLPHFAFQPEERLVTGLSAPVMVFYDRWDVPHLWAAHERDLFVAQGYIAAQDRLWQMLLRRQAARGRLADWLGPQVAETDALLAARGFYAEDEEPPASSSPCKIDSSAWEAYAAGVNAYLAQSNRSQPVELTVLKMRGVSVALDPWSPQDSWAVARLIAWAQGFTLDSDHQLAGLLTARLGDERAQELLQVPVPYPRVPFSPVVRQVMQLAAIPLTGGYSAPTTPPAWYIMGLHSPSCQVAGATVAGLPGVSLPSSGQPAGEAQDFFSETARQLMPYLVALTPQDWLQRRVTPMMARWDYRLEADSAPAAVYEAWVEALGCRTLADELGPELYARYAAGGRGQAALAHLVTRPQSPWWDDLTTPPRETRDEMMQRAYADALDELGRRYGDLHTIWEWGQMHAATFRHVLGETWPAWRLFNRGPVFLGGDGLTGEPVPFDAAISFEPVLVPALKWRVEADGEVMFALAGEQSGSPRLGPGGRLDEWRAGQYIPLLGTESEVKANTQRRLILRPAESQCSDPRPRGSPRRGALKTRCPPRLGNENSLTMSHSLVRAALSFPLRCAQGFDSG